MHNSDLLLQIFGSKFRLLSREERIVLETEVLIKIYKEFENRFRETNKNYFSLLKFSAEKEKSMFELNFVRSMINDILLSEDYTLEGIAYYTQTDEEVICDLMIGKNISPSFPLTYKIINLHRTVRPKLYEEIMKKISLEYLSDKAS